MIEKITLWSFKRPLFGIALVVTSAIAGWFAFQSLPADVFPDLSTPTFNLIIQEPSLSAEELETSVTIPLESALNGLPGMRRVRSLNAQGVVQLTVEFDAHVDYKSARQLITERVNQAVATFPSGVEPPLISSIAVRLNEVMELSLDADAAKADFLTLRDLAEFDIHRRLTSIRGVGTVEKLGGHLKEFQILLDPDRMLARNVTFGTVHEAIKKSNHNSSGGILTRGETEWNVRAIGRVASVDELRRTVVDRKDNIPILLGDVADVREGGAFRRGIAHRTAGEIVSLRIIKQFGANTTELSTSVRDAVAEIQPTLPDGVRLVIDYDQAEVIEHSLRGLGKAILIGAILVVFVIGLLLGDLRAAALVTITIPVSMAASGLLLQYFNCGLNAMTLGGLAIAVGLLVDAGIIICENIVHRLTEARPSSADRRIVVSNAAAEMSHPIFFATLILIGTFGPLATLGGLEGKLYGPLALSVIGAVAASLIVSIFALPFVASVVLRPRREGIPEDVPIIRAIKFLYKPSLHFVLRHAGAVRIITLTVTIPALFLAYRIGNDFLPKLDEGALMVNTSVSPAASLDLVDRLNHRVEDKIREFTEVKEVIRRTGRGERTEDPMQHTYSDILVILKEDAKRRGDVLADAIREKLASIPGIQSSFTTPLGMRIDEGLAGTPADLSIKIFGSDLEILQKLGDDAKKLVSGVPGLTDVRSEAISGTPQIRISIDREQCNNLGIKIEDVTRAITMGLIGEKVSDAWVGSKRYDVIIKLIESARRDLTDLRKLRIHGGEGFTIPLEQVARIEESSGPSSIRREAGVRRNSVDASVSGRDLGSAAGEVKNILASKLTLPKGYFISLGGKIEGQERAQRALILTIGAAGVLVLLLLYAALGSVAEAFVIIATLPDALVGGIVALWLAGGTWNVSSLVGLVGLFGIAVQNGLVLLTQTKTLLRSGLPFHESLTHACISRVRPKLMTALTAILGLLPLIVFNFRGAELERPLAIVMIGGLLTSTFFTLLALPTFYAWVYSIQSRGRRIVS